MFAAISIPLEAASAIASANDPAPETSGPAAPVTGEVVIEPADLERSVETPAVGLLDPELQAVLDHERAELARLTQRFEEASDAADKIAVQRAIDEIKQRAEIELLQIQARRMREQGFETQAAELEQALTSMLERLPSEVSPQSAAEPR